MQLKDQARHRHCNLQFCSNLDMIFVSRHSVTTIIVSCDSVMLFVLSFCNYSIVHDRNHPMCKLFRHRHQVYVPLNSCISPCAEHVRLYSVCFSLKHSLTCTHPCISAQHIDLHCWCKTQWRAAKVKGKPTPFITITTNRLSGLACCLSW